MNSKLRQLGFAPVTALEQIAKGGSMRSFFRFNDAVHGPCIHCVYSEEKEENFLYAPIAAFLESCGVAVPKFLYHDACERILVMEDFGSLDLLDFSKGADAAVVESAYRLALEEAVIIHRDATDSFNKSPIKLMPGFDDALYIWEQDYFFDNLVCGLFQLEVPKPAYEWEGLRKMLLGSSQSLVHRDFQSQNIIMRPNGRVGIIDFQGMRIGVPWYDVASLLFDPYASVAPEMRGKLYAYYCSSCGLDPAGHERLFLSAASQRLMQALGAFAFLSMQKGKLEYLAHIPVALGLLSDCAALAGLDMTAGIANLCRNCLADNPHMCKTDANAK